MAQQQIALEQPANTRLEETSNFALQQRHLEQSTNQAVVNLELRAMKQRLTGAEAARLIMVTLEDYHPHGDVTTWRWHHSRRQIGEILSHWRAYLQMIGMGDLATQRLWSLVVESGYARALEEGDGDTAVGHVLEQRQQRR